MSVGVLCALVVVVPCVMLSSFLLSSNSRGHEKLPEDGTYMPKHVGARVSNKE
jgi:hypothetical protein